VFRTAWIQYNQLVANLKVHEWHTPCYYPLGLKPVRVLVNAAIFELAIHGWDIGSALEPSAQPSTYRIPLVSLAQEGGRPAPFGKPCRIRDPWCRKNALAMTGWEPDL